MNLKIASVQSSLFWESIDENLKHFEGILKQLSKVDLVILPEMFTTGFSMNVMSLSEKMDGQSLAWMKQMANKYSISITGSLIIEEEGQFYNRMIFMYPDGSYQQYDKRHLFRLAKEQETFTAGTTRKIVKLKGWKINLNICYDLRFPVWSRNNDDYDLILYVANWPEKRVKHWSALLKARAIENLAYVIGVNRVGKDGKGHNYSGHTAGFLPSGDLLFESVKKEEFIYSELSKEELINYRNKFGFHNDRDKFKLII